MWQVTLLSGTKVCMVQREALSSFCNLNWYYDYAKANGACKIHLHNSIMEPIYIFVFPHWHKILKWLLITRFSRHMVFELGIGHRIVYASFHLNVSRNNTWSKVLSMSASFALGWSHGRGNTRTWAAQRHACNALYDVPTEMWVIA